MGSVHNFQPKPLKDPSGRPPVHDLSAERSILSSILDETQPDHAVAFDRVATILRANHFFDPRHCTIFAAAEALAETGARVTWLSVTFWLADRDQSERAGGDKYLQEVAAARTCSAHLEEDAARIRDMARQRDFTERAWRVVAAGYDRQQNVQEWLESSQRELEEIATPPEHRSIVSLGDALREVFVEIEASASDGQGVVGISTGNDDLDEILGGWHDEELTLLGARPAMGKSAAGMSFAINAAKAKPSRGDLLNGVLFASVEMSRKQLVSRTICTMARVNYNKVRRRQIQDADWANLAHAGQWMSRLPLWIDDHSGLTPAELRAKCRRIKAREEKRGVARLSLVVVDYIQRMKSGLPSDRRRSRQEELGYISWSLKALAKELQIPVIALAQLNRGVHNAQNKRPQLSDLRESGDLEQDADNVIFLHREEYYSKQATPPEWQGVAEFIVEKQRNGPSDTGYSRYHREYALFESDRELSSNLRGLQV